MAPREVRLLLVDDDPSAIQLMGRMLSQYPDQRFATSGEAALRMAREVTPDHVLDVDMPGMSGLDVCEALKADPALASVPVVFATSHDPSTLLQVTAFRKGAGAQPDRFVGHRAADPAGPADDEDPPSGKRRRLRPVS